MRRITLTILSLVVLYLDIFCFMTSDLIPKIKFLRQEQRKQGFEMSTKTATFSRRMERVGNRAADIFLKSGACQSARTTRREGS